MGPCKIGETFVFNPVDTHSSPESFKQEGEQTVFRDHVGLGFRVWGLGFRV